MQAITRRTCRVCGGDLKYIYDFGEFYFSTFVRERGENLGKSPLMLVECASCSLLQLGHTAPTELMYTGQYWYKSGVNEKIRNDLKEIVNCILKMAEGGIWIDIGANDGTLLSFVPPTFHRIGVEPAKNLLAELKEKSDEAISSFWEDYQGDKAQVITAIGMMYDSEDPNAFVSNVKKHLADDGIFVAQMMTLKQMLDNNDLGNICHEHLEYYSYKTLVNLFERNGLEIFKVEENDINGGSYRLFARHLDRGSVELCEEEPDYSSFVSQVINNRYAVVEFIRYAVSVGKKIYGYGASTKFNTILQFYGLGSEDIVGIADRNPEKIGKFTVGTHIPVVSEEEGRANADFFLVGPWGFFDEFVKREDEWMKKGGSFISHTPVFKIQRGSTNP